MFKRLAFVLVIAGWLLLAAGGAQARPIIGPQGRSGARPADMVELPADVMAETPVYGYRVIAVYPHDADAFTQGLVYYQGDFYEGIGLHGRSSLRKVDLETGEVLQIFTLPDQYFGEGVTLFGDKLYQLTWQSHVGFIYDRASFDFLTSFKYPTEGWGLTHNGRELIMSDGTPTLHFLDPNTLQELRQVSVRDENGPVWRLNELEYIDGEVYANIWQTDRIARIDPDTGRVKAWIDLSGLLPPEDRAGADVLNGIAWDAARGRLFVTGKLWPKLFQIELTPPVYNLFCGASHSDESKTNPCLEYANRDRDGMAIGWMCCAAGRPIRVSYIGCDAFHRRSNSPPHVHASPHANSHRSSYTDSPAFTGPG
jgi:glutamine cyclotransferase